MAKLPTEYYQNAARALKFRKLIEAKFGTERGAMGRAAHILGIHRSNFSSMCSGNLPIRDHHFKMFLQLPDLKVVPQVDLSSLDTSGPKVQISFGVNSGTFLLVKRLFNGEPTVEEVEALFEKLVNQHCAPKPPAPPSAEPEDPLS